MEKRIFEAIEKYQMQDIYSGTVLAFSGGADSCALLHFLSKRCKNLVAVHINHMIRGDEALRDEEFAKKTAEKYGVKFIARQIDIPKIAKRDGLGIEETARRERYKVFYEILNSNSEYKCIATAHNSDDNAETVLFNLTRGTGTRGLSGIKPVNDFIVRPLIFLSKKEILDYCLANNIEYVTDSTNLSTVYTRNKIRHNVIPCLKEINPDLLDAILRLGEIVTSDEEYFKKQVDKIILESVDDGKMPVSVLRSLDYSILSRLLREVSHVALDHTATRSCIELINNAQAGAYVNLKDGISFKIEHSYAAFIKTEELKDVNFLIPLNNGHNYIEAIDTYVSLNTEDAPSGYCLDLQIKLDKEKITSPLYARSKRDGDKIKAGKMTKRLKQIFVDTHLPSHKRDKIPLICMDDEIIAALGVVIADGYKGNGITIKTFKKRKTENG
ncbi:MAG: tRNA lysidine(34) synthetase TilS [Clostridia bacterium]|nr:tRNA lysidine(34) synthetase TilS [Clostridia bacterium]